MKKSFEDEFKGIVENHKETVDLTKLWSGVEHGITEKKRKKRVIWIFLLVGVLTAGSAIGYYSLSTSSDSKIISDLDEHSQSITDGTPKPLKTDLEKSENIIQEVNTAEEGIYKEETIVNTMINSSIDPSIGNEKPLNTTIQNSGFTTTASTKNELDDEGQTSRGIETKQVSVKLTELPIIDNTSRSLTHSIEEITDEVRSTQEISLIEKFHALGIQYSTQEKKMVLNKIIEEPTRKNPNRRIRFTTAVSFGYQNYESNITDDYYRTMERYDFALEIPLVKYKDWSIWSGIHYGVFQDEFAWEGEYLISKEESYVSDEIYRVGMQVQEIYSNGEVKYLVDQKLLKYNTRSIISLPIKLQYAHNINRLTFEGYGTMLLNYQLANEYYYIESNGAPQVYLGKNQFVQPSFIIGGNLGYRVSKNVMLISGIHVRGLNYGFENSTELQSFKNRRLGVNLGVERRF